MANIPVLRTKITPPPLSSRTLLRPRLSAALEQALQHRLTLLQAGAGYGKSTALSALANAGYPTIWYRLGEEDSEPLVFLVHLCHAILQTFPGAAELPLAVLETWDGALGLLRPAALTDQIINAFSEVVQQPGLLILDDTHLVQNSPDIAAILDRLVGLAPADLHLIFSTRPPFSLPNLYRWRSRGEVLLIDQSSLAFSAEEIFNLFTAQYNYPITPEEAENLHAATEGWAITLQLIWQSLRSGAAASISDAITRQAASLESLFDLLARDVIATQPQDVQDFLRLSATLRSMTADACDALCACSGSSAMLAYLRRQELFVVDQGDSSLRYHPIFQRFLRQQTALEQTRLWHSRAAAYYRQQGDLDSAFYHLLQAERPVEAADLLDAYAVHLLSAGRLGPLAAYLDALPAETLRTHPMLIFSLGDLARLHSRFEEALGWYQQAETLWRERGMITEVGRALRGQARVYLDTVNPSKAEELLQQALRLSDGTVDRESQARLYELLAENKLNAGKPEEAERLSQQAESLRSENPSDSQLVYRVLLRTGRLEEARRLLEKRAESERQTPVHTPRAHRETLFLLSLIYSLQGEGQAAHQAALEGARRAETLDSPFVTGVGFMRLGHAAMLLPDQDRYSSARRHFESAVEISRQLSVPRLRVEALWGLCRAYGYTGDLLKAQQLAQEGIEIARQAGDEWVASLTRIALGASFAQALREESALEWLNQAARGFQECSDPFGATAARLWICLVWFRQRKLDLLAPLLNEVLATCRVHGYDALFLRATLLGPDDPHSLVPLLILAREQGWEAAYASQLLDAIGLAEISYHPGYQLKVATLGAFQVWRGSQPVLANHWQREKTRQLFQLLITHDHEPLDREQIFEHLWPELDPTTAQRNFKVALNTLYNVLEPERLPGQESAYILRQGSIYGLRPAADLWLDSRVFAQSIERAEALLAGDPEQAARLYRTALELYQGEYLPEARYETWAAAQRESLEVLFLRAADQLCTLQLAANHIAETVEICQRILAQDNCWERAYRYLMQAYHRLGDRGQVARTYQRCIQTLHDELDVSPSPETTALFAQLKQ